MAAHQAPPSLGFSRQEHWSGLPFSSPMHESEKWKWSHLVVSDPQGPRGLQPSRLLRPWDLPGKSTGVGCHCFLSIHLFTHYGANRYLLCSCYVPETGHWVRTWSNFRVFYLTKHEFTNIHCHPLVVQRVPFYSPVVMKEDLGRVLQHHFV